MLFRLLSGSAAPRSERCRRSSPETTSRLRLPAGKPTAAPSPLPEPPCIPHLEPPAISIEQFRRMRHFFSIAEESPGLFRTFSGHVLTVVQINVQNRPACPAATQLERKSPPGRWLQAPRSASSPRQGACAHPSTHSTDPHRPMPLSRFSPEEISARSRLAFQPYPRYPPHPATRATAATDRTSTPSRACCPSTGCTSHTQERGCESPRCSPLDAYVAR